MLAVAGAAPAVSLLCIGPGQMEVEWEVYLSPWLRIKGWEPSVGHSDLSLNWAVSQMTSNMSWGSFTGWVEGAGAAILEGALGRVGHVGGVIGAVERLAIPAAAGIILSATIWAIERELLAVIHKTRSQEVPADRLDMQMDIRRESGPLS